jgi:vitamin B12 transporter
MKTFSIVMRGKGLAFAACAAGCVTSFAQTSASATPELKPVVVTASRNPQQLTDTLPHTTVLFRADIERSQASDVLTLLQREAGVQLTQNGGRGTSSSLYMRGSASLQTLVLLDGVPMTRQDATGSLGLEHIALDQIERIEIVRGNVSAIYGSGAIGGVVQMFSKRAAGAPSANIKLETGSRGSSKIVVGGQAALGTQGTTRLSAGFASDRTDGISALNQAQQPAANPDRDDYKNRSENFSLLHDLQKGHTLGLTLQRSNGRYDFDSPFNTPTDLQWGHRKIQNVRVSSDNRFTHDWRSQLSYSDFSEDGSDVFGGPFGFTSIATTKVRQLQWSNSVTLGNASLLTLGLEQQQQSIEADDGAPYTQSRNVNAVFAGYQWQNGLHQFQFNLRNDKAGHLAPETTGYLGYGYTVSPQWKLTASTSTAFNIPPLGYLFYPFGGNANLQPEKAKSSEIGLQWSQANQVFKATWFDTQNKNLFEYDFLTSAFANVARTRNRGLEMSYSGKMGGIDVRASLTSQNPRDVNTGSVLNRRAKALVSLSLDQSLGAWQWGADLRMTGARMDGAVRLSGYEVVDLRARYAISQQLSVYGRVENLLDRRYQTVSQYNSTPRGIFVGMQWQPKF